MRVITLYNSKGGSAKSTVTANLGGLLADRFGLRVLLIDGDPQKTLSEAFAIRLAAPGGYREFLKESTSNPRLPLPLESYVSTTAIDGLDIIQCNIGMEELSAQLSASQESYLKLRLILDRLRNTDPDRYDVVLIDSSGIVGTISYVCAIAADRVLSPIVPDRVTVTAFFTGAEELLQNIQSNPYAPYRDMPFSALIVRAKNTVDSRAFSEMLRTELAPEKTKETILSRVQICRTEIPESAFYARASTMHVPVHRINVQQGEQLAALAQELLPDIKPNKQVAA